MKGKIAQALLALSLLFWGELVGRKRKLQKKQRLS